MTMLDNDYEQQLRTEFLDQMQDRLGQLSARLQGGGSYADLRLEFGRDVQNLKGLAAGYGYPVIAMVVQRLEAYLADVTDLSTRAIGDIQYYIDRIAELTDRGQQPDPEEAGKLLQSLPATYNFNVSDVVVKHVEVMVVTPTRVVAKLVGAELTACGFRPIILHDPVEAFAQAVRVPPGMVIASAVMEPMSGVELLLTLGQLRATKAVPLAVLTSLDADKKPLHVLPDNVAVIHSGSAFGADFAEAATRFNLG